MIDEKRLRAIELRIKQEFADEVIDSKVFHCELTVVLKNGRTLDVMRFLRDDDDLSFNFLVDITAVDYRDNPDLFPTRFAVVYHLLSFKTEDRVRIKVAVDGEAPRVSSLMPLWKGANWLEREVYDMFGIDFEGHADLRRILSPEGFRDFPLRKDYPLRGKGERNRFAKLKRDFPRPEELPKR